jgi:acyl-CoA reductase-like NAD-dependent aldehyde dehydrogenase
LEVKEVAISTTVLGERGVLLSGQEVHTGDAYEILSPYDSTPVSVVHRARPEDFEQAIAGAASAFETTRQLASWQREQVLKRVAESIARRREELAGTIAREAGKPVTTARAEVDRAAFTFRVAAEEAKRIYGEIVPLDWLPGNERRVAHVRRVPLGPIAGITPFNFPLNLVAHKVAPALAAGNPIIIRPASQTPTAALILGQLVLEAGWPADAISVVPSSTDAARPLVVDDRIKLLTFTGSPAVGWGLKAQSGRKRVTLELGGNAAVIVHRDADIAYAAERVAWGGFTNAGQTCISVQRVFVHEDVHDEFVADLIRRVEDLNVGDPLDEDTDVGPVIDGANALRIEEWLLEAKAAGATVLTGGEREGCVWWPTVLTDVREDLRVACEEAFAPLVGITRFSDIEDAIDAAARSDFGLQAGLFTYDMRVIEQAFARINVGGLMVNDVSTFRIDHMPYGGVKASGFGREGLRYAIEEMTEHKLLTIHTR